MSNRIAVIKRDITDNLFGTGGGVKSSSFNKYSGPSDIKETKGLQGSIFNPIGSRKVAMFISSKYSEIGKLLTYSHTNDMRQTKPCSIVLTHAFTLTLQDSCVSCT